MRTTGHRSLLPLAVVCCLGLAADQAAAEYLPLTPGNNWTYFDESTGSTFTVEIGGSQIMLGGNVYHSLRGYTPERVYVRYNEFGNLVAWNEELERDEMLTSFEYVEGAWFEANFRECPQQGQVQRDRAKHDGPAGTWSVLEIQYRTFACADAGTVSEQYADNIGMVRRVVNTIGGPRTYNLIHARVGNQTVSGPDSGGFSVDAIPVNTSGKWLATMRVDLPAGKALKLTFPSGQEYDARLRDLDGRIVWTWSADKLFVQAVHTTEVADGWSATIEVPHPPAIPGSPHRYILEVWLTNVEDEPQFAAATIVETLAIGPARAAASRSRR